MDEKIGKRRRKDTSRHRGRTLPAGEDCEMLHNLKKDYFYYIAQTLRDEGAIPYTTIGGKIYIQVPTRRKNYLLFADNRS